MNLRRFFNRRKRDADLASEIEAHLRHGSRGKPRRGLSPEEALRRA